ncbi:fumarylacetoacetate hydrolase family protein [Micromonospora sp. NPDC048909]|uniref:fumarylacetoacetate hydrolase family protein n=1 Tax=Micromonospora sp. NPDC048909 TaxID=3155643 RepID=UPI0033EB7432
MKLLRIGELGAERPYVLLDGDEIVDVSDVTHDFDSAFFDSDGPARLTSFVGAGAPRTRLEPGQRLGAPLSRPGKIVCIGLNYADHADESGMQRPNEPIVFLKASNTLSGPNDPVFIPRGSTKTDWEVELGVVIGKRCRYLSTPQEGLGSVAGYLICHDVSEREFQLERGGQWVKGKSCETFNPAGPWLVTPDEIVDPGALDLWLDVNGERRQTGSTKDMIFDVGYLIHYLSQFMVLEPGDIINTGTPPGVALGMLDPVYLRPGDVVELGITGLGRQRQTFVPAP